MTAGLGNYLTHKPLTRGNYLIAHIIREVKEETGLDIEPYAIVGVYSDPNHVVAYDDGDVRQQFSVCFACHLVGGHIATSDESLDVRFFPPNEVDALPMTESIRQRVRDYLTSHDQPIIA